MKASDPKTKLIRYMNIKNKLSKGYLFNKYDKLAIINWSDEIAYKVWNQLETNILIYKAENICQHTCPFCIRFRHFKKQGGCKACDWGRNHIMCAYIDSDYYKVKNEAKFTNRFYSNAINFVNGGSLWT